MQKARRLDWLGLRLKMQERERGVEPEAVIIELQIGRIKGALDPEQIVFGSGQGAEFVEHGCIQTEDVVTAASHFLPFHELNELFGGALGAFNDPKFGFREFDGELMKFANAAFATFDPEPGAEFVIELDEVWSEGNVRKVDIDFDLESFAVENDKSEELQADMHDGFRLALADDDLAWQRALRVLAFELEGVFIVHVPWLQLNA
jgi:hypothetical protein